MNAELVDAGDRRFRIFRGSDQHFPRFREIRGSLSQELRPVHGRQRLIDQHQRDRFVLFLAVRQLLERLLRGARSREPVVLPVASLQVLLNSSRLGGVMAEIEQNRLLRAQTGGAGQQLPRKGKGLFVVHELLILRQGHALDLTKPPSGKLAMGSVERAGGLLGKYSAYTAFMRPNSVMFVMKTVVFTTLSILLPAASNTTLRFSSTRRVCSSMVSPTILPEADRAQSVPP